MRRSTGLIAAGALALLASALVRGLSPAPAAAQSDTPSASVLVSLLALQPGTLPATLTAYGSIQPGPDADQTISLPAGGVLSALPVIAGAHVAQGQALATITPDPQSLADYKKAVSAVTAAEANQSHIAALAATHLATKADLAAANQTLDDARGTLAALRAGNAGAARSLVAPFAGVVSAILAAPGTVLAAGAPVLRLTNTDGLVASLGVPPAQAAGLAPQGPATVTLLDSNRAIMGHIAQIASMADPQTGLSTVIIALDTHDGINPGMPVQAVLTSGMLSGFVVPRDSVLNDDQGNYVFIADAKHIAHRVAVTIVGDGGDQTVITSDHIQPGAMLVTTGAYQLDDGVAVRMADSASAPADSGK